MSFLKRSARLSGVALLLAGAAGAQVRSDTRIPISKEVTTTTVTEITSDGAVALDSARVALAVLPTFSVAAYGPLTEMNMTAILAAGDSMEIRMGQLAQSKGTAMSVRDYGSMLVNDHTAHLPEVIEVITDEDVGVQKPANDPEGARMRAMLTWLQNTPSSAAWDAAFLRFQAQHHQNLIDLFNANIKNAHDDDLEELIEASLASFARHRDTARSTATGLGVTIQ